jgi:hypothetical protein
MTKYLIGCSNVYRFWDPKLDPKKEYEIIRATSYGMLQRELSAFKENGSPIIIAVVENIIQDSIHQATSLPEAREMGKQAIGKLINLIKTNEKNYQESVIAIVCPTGRPGMDWYDLNVTGWTEDLLNAITGSNIKNLAIIETINIKSQAFEEEGIHFTKEVGAKYVEQIIKYGQQMPINTPPKNEANKDQTRLMEVDITSTPAKKTWQTRDTVEERLSKLEKQAISSNIAISKIREELDANTNEKKMDTVVISGIRPSKRWPHQGSYKVKEEWTRNEAIIAIKKFNKNIGDREVKWAHTFSKPSITPIIMEIKLGSKESALNIKRIFRDLKRDDIRIEDDMYVTNNYTQATRVRIEIMRAIVKKCATEEDRMFLNQYCNRPFVRVTNTRTRIEKVMTFTDLVQNYGCRVEDKDLDLAYKRAGKKFKGQMGQIFGVLKETAELNQHQTTRHYNPHNTQNEENRNNSNNTPIGARKRRAQEEDQQTKRTK